MAPLSKGKEKVIDGYGSESAGKRKRNNAGNDAVRKRNRSVLQFFEDAADVGDDDCSDDSLFGGIIFFFVFHGGFELHFRMEGFIYLFTHWKCWRKKGIFLGKVFRWLCVGF